MQSKLPLLPSGPGGVRKSAFHGPWQNRSYNLDRPVWLRQELSTPFHEAQLLTYLKLDKKPLGLLINFNVPVLKQGVKRVVCGDLFQEETGGRGFAFRLFSFLCASVPLWQPKQGPGESASRMATPKNQR